MAENKPIGSRLMYLSEIETEVRNHQKCPGTFFGVRDVEVNGYTAPLLFKYLPQRPLDYLISSTLIAIPIRRQGQSLRGFLKDLEGTKFEEGIVAYLEIPNPLQKLRKNTPRPLQFVDLSKIAKKASAHLDVMKVRRGDISHLSGQIKFLEKEIEKAYGLLQLHKTF